jgi:hypothetical protein
MRDRRQNAPDENSATSSTYESSAATESILLDHVQPNSGSNIMALEKLTKRLSRKN